MREHKTISISSQIFEQLEHEILIGKYQKGEVLTENKLSETLGVSRTPIREALRRLEQEHIIEETSRGAVVIGILPQDIEDMYEIRLRLEGMAAELTAKNITEDGIAKMREILDLQRYYAQKKSEDNSDNIKEYDSKFHEMLYKSCGSRALCDTLLPIHKKLIKYRKVSVSKASRAEQSVQEHTAILDAIAKRDGALAAKLAIEHIQNAKTNILSKEI